MSSSIKSRHYLPSTACSRAWLALRQLWPALGSPCSPASCSHLFSGQGSGEIVDSLFTGQAQIGFLTAPPERLCQGKLALQNCSLTGKCVSLFISHSHWKKGGAGGVVGHDVILSTELLKGIAFHGDFQAPLVFCCTIRNRTWSFSSFSQHSATSPHLFLGFLLPQGFASSLEKEPGSQEVEESCLSISYKGDLNLGKQLLVGGDGGQVLGRPGDKPTAFRNITEF